jgi:hypothetical protein
VPACHLGSLTSLPLPSLQRAPLGSSIGGGRVTLRVDPHHISFWLSLVSVALVGRDFRLTQVSPALAFHFLEESYPHPDPKEHQKLYLRLGVFTKVTASLQLGRGHLWSLSPRASAALQVAP